MTITFAETIGESRLDDFLSRTWGRSFCHIPGSAGRFHEILSWSDINGMLQKHRLEPPRLRLVRAGQFAPKSSYLRYDGPRVPFVIPEKLSAHLREGYTLIVDAVDDMLDGVMRLAEDFERSLEESVQVNMYAGWREQQGFHRHCDTHDVVVLQVFGRKYWRVYNGGRRHPLKDDIAPNDAVPQEIAWEGVLEDGDVLYLPRGWWHEASGMGELTLHLTFGIHQRTGVHLVHWLADQLRASESFRANLGRFASARQQKEQLAELRSQLLEAFDDGVLDRYFNHQRVRARSREWANLPWSVHAPGLPPDSARVALAAPFRLDLERVNGSVHFTANGREWQFAASAFPLLDRLNAGPATIAELSGIGSGLEPSTVREFVVELAREGLARLEGEPDS